MNKYGLFINGILFCSIEIENENNYNFLPVENFGLDEVSIRIMEDIILGKVKQKFIVDEKETLVEINEGNFKKNIEKLNELYSLNYFVYCIKEI